MVGSDNINTERLTHIMRIEAQPEHLHVRDSKPQPRIADGKYVVRIARSLLEVEAALRPRYEVFRVELNGDSASDPSRLEFDEYDFKCRHLIVVDITTSETVGTYRLNSFEAAGGVHGFYSYREFGIEALPRAILREGIEIGRACVAPEHRNTKVLFLLWKGLVSYLQSEGKRYFFGCCSMFTRDASEGASAYRQLAESGHLHPKFILGPRQNAVDLSEAGASPVQLPNLFN